MPGYFNVTDTNPVRRYELTDLGRALRDPLLALQVSAESHADDVLAAQTRFDDRQTPLLEDVRTE
jgi:DNA-binding HxlR family transcriptional regulator